MDLLADALSVIHFKGTVYCQTEFSAPWGVDWEHRAGHAGFFMVMRGGCYMEASAFAEPVPLCAGDFVFSAKAQGYLLKDAPSSSTLRFDDVAGNPGTVSRHRIIKHGGGGLITNLMMGCFELDETSNNPLVRSLPDFIVVRSQDLQDVPWLETTLRFLSAECVDEMLGSSIAVARLTELLFVQAIRFHLRKSAAGGGQTNWLRGAADPQIGKALSRMHERPEVEWTVMSLADSVAMSRSAFAARFKELTDMTPLEYLTSWRMQKAEKMICDGRLSLAEIAGAVGYQSESAFSKAFKRERGMAPGVFRRQAAVG